MKSFCIYVFIICSLFLCLSLGSCKHKENKHNSVNDNVILVDSVVGYDYNEKEFMLNNWSIKNTADNYLDIVNKLNVSLDSIVEKGDSHFDEHGYRYYNCYFDENLVNITGESEFNDAYYIHGFKIKTSDFLINGLKVGDSKESIFHMFPKYNLSDGNISVYLMDQIIIFHMNKDIITSIELLTPP